MAFTRPLDEFSLPFLGK